MMRWLHKRGYARRPRIDSLTLVGWFAIGCVCLLGYCLWLKC